MDEIETDIDILLECLKDQKSDYSGSKRSLHGLSSTLVSCDKAKEYFRRVGGLKYVQGLLFQDNPSSVLQAVMYCLACAVENDVFGQKLLTTKKVFGFLHGAFIDRKSDKKFVSSAIFLLLSLVSNNSAGQNLANSSSCVIDLVLLFRHFAEVCSLSPQAQSEDTQVLQAVVLALSSCVNNPQNETNQKLCSTILPLCFRLIMGNQVPDLNISILNLTGQTVGGNVFNQNRLKKFGGLDSLLQHLHRCVDSNNTQPDVALLKQAEAAVIVISACIMDHDENCHYFLEQGGLKTLLKLLSQPDLDSSSILKVTNAIGQAVEHAGSDMTELAHEEVSLLVRLLTETQDDEVVHTIKYILNSCRQLGQLGNLNTDELRREHAQNMNRMKRLSAKLGILDGAHCAVSGMSRSLHSLSDDGDARAPISRESAPHLLPQTWHAKHPASQVRSSPSALHHLQDQQPATTQTQLDQDGEATDLMGRAEEQHLWMAFQHFKQLMSSLTNPFFSVPKQNHADNRSELTQDSSQSAVFSKGLQDNHQTEKTFGCAHSLLHWSHRGADANEKSRTLSGGESLQDRTRFVAKNGETPAVVMSHAVIKPQFCNKQKMIPCLVNTKDSFPQPEYTEVALSHQCNLGVTVPQCEETLLHEDNTEVKMPHQDNGGVTILSHINQGITVPHRSNLEVTKPYQSNTGVTVPCCGNLAVTVPHHCNTGDIVPPRGNLGVTVPHHNNPGVTMPHQSSTGDTVPPYGNLGVTVSHQGNTGVTEPCCNVNPGDGVLHKGNEGVTASNQGKAGVTMSHQCNMRVTRPPQSNMGITMSHLDKKGVDADIERVMTAYTNDMEIRTCTGTQRGMTSLPSSQVEVFARTQGTQTGVTSHPDTMKYPMSNPGTQLVVTNVNANTCSLVTSHKDAQGVLASPPGTGGGKVSNDLTQGYLTVHTCTHEQGLLYSDIVPNLNTSIVADRFHYCTPEINAAASTCACPDFSHSVIEQTDVSVSTMGTKGMESVAGRSCQEEQNVNGASTERGFVDENSQQKCVCKHDGPWVDTQYGADLHRPDCTSPLLSGSVEQKYCPRKCCSDQEIRSNQTLMLADQNRIPEEGNSILNESDIHVRVRNTKTGMQAEKTIFKTPRTHTAAGLRKGLKRATPLSVSRAAVPSRFKHQGHPSPKTPSQHNESSSAASPSHFRRTIHTPKLDKNHFTIPGHTSVVLSKKHDTGDTCFPPSPAPSEFDCLLVKAATRKQSVLRTTFPWFLRTVSCAKNNVSTQSQTETLKSRSHSALVNFSEDHTMEATTNTSSHSDTEGRKTEGDPDRDDSFVAEAISDTSSCMSEVYSVLSDSPEGRLLLQHREEKGQHQPLNTDTNSDCSGEGGMIQSARRSREKLCPGCLPSGEPQPLNSRTFNIVIETSPHTCYAHRRVRQIERDYIITKASRARLDKKLSYQRWKEGLKLEKEPELSGKGQDHFSKNESAKVKTMSVYDFESSGNGNDLKRQVSPPLGKTTGSLTPERQKTRPCHGVERRPRVPYSHNELCYLVEGVRMLGKCWQQIINTFPFHPSRTAVDIMEKYKRMQAHSSARRRGHHRGQPLAMCEERRLRRAVARLGHNWTNILRSERFAAGRTAEELRDRWRRISKTND